MTDDQDFQESLDRYFEIEAAELLQTIEETLVVLVEEKTIERVHTLMRAAHTIKGSAANCGFKTIETIAHHLEDVFQALYPAELEIDAELGSLLLEGYDCLYDPLSALLAGIPYDEAATLERTATLFAKLQDHLGDFFGRETPLPTAAELGFDVIGSIFTDSIPQDLEDLATAIASKNAGKVSESLRSLAEFLLELGGSYSLPGIAAIASTTISALDRHPARSLELAPIALANFQQAQIAIVGGDRSVGGQVSSELGAWNEYSDNFSSEQSDSVDHASDWLSLAEFDDSVGTDRVESTTGSASEDWLSLVDELAPEIPVKVAEQPTESASEDWLSLVDESTPEISVEVTESTTGSASEDWLSLVDTSDSVSDLDDSIEIVDDDSEIIEVSSFFESESILVPRGSANDLALTQREYPIELIESHTSSNLSLVTSNGIDRIFQSISLEHPGSVPEEVQSSATNSSKVNPASEREAPAESVVSVRVATIQLERLSHTIGELLIDDNQQYLRSEQLQAMAQETVEQYRRCEQKLRQVNDWADNNTLLGERQKLSSRRTAKTRAKKSKKPIELNSYFDSMELDVYSELSILLQNFTDDITDLGLKVSTLFEMTQKSRMTLGKRKQLLAEAQSELFEARMVEISTVLNRFPRLLQQMIASHRKPAQLELIGSEVSIDKIIAEKLYDPLLHLIRNAYDHGVEAPEIRAAQGKSETGKLTIKAYHQGNRTKIEVSDDGQGLNWVRIRQRAIDMNLLDPSYPVTEAELAEIMFAPGFSTAEKVNDLSGRGIGLDVVRDRLGALQGTIDVRSILGKGTTFVMQFPLNLTTTRLMICESAGSVYALRSESISQVLLPPPDRIQSQSLFTDLGTSKFLQWGDGDNRKLIPIYAVNSLIDYHCEIGTNETATNLFPTQVKNTTNALLLLDIDNEQICLEVSRILVEQELVVKSLGQTFGMPSYIQGYSVLGDGSLTLAIDPVELLARVSTNTSTSVAASNLPALPSTVRPALAPAADQLPTAVAEKLEEIVNSNSTKPGKQLQVLIVDDSLVQRQSLVRSLTKAGCQVIQAGHGREGLLKLQEHPRIRLVVCDIEMPQMNGFEFLSHCRQDPKLSQIPIVMLTTRGGQKHRQLAMTLGAKDYLTKPQSEKDLLDIVAKLEQPVSV